MKYLSLLCWSAGVVMAGQAIASEVLAKAGKVV